jgi:hypothetical protein
MPATVTPAIEALVGYLHSCGGADRYEFFDTANEPDPVAARACAERLRSSLGSHLGTVARVEQSGNRVTMTLIESAG